MYNVKDGERLDDLQLDGLKIIQKIDGYGSTSDSVLLANFVKTKKTDICVEIGAGCGIISILVNYKERPKKIFAFELQSDACDLAVRNVEGSNFSDSIKIIDDKIQNWKKYFNGGEVDVIFSNPPYFKYDPNMCGNVEEKILSRFDKMLSLEDFFMCSSKLLKLGGKLYFVHSSNRFTECINVMSKFNLTAKRVYFVHPNQTKDSTVFLCEAVKGGKQGLQIMPPLFTNNLDGVYIQTIQKLYKR